MCPSRLRVSVLVLAFLAVFGLTCAALGPLGCVARPSSAPAAAAPPPDAGATPEGGR
jgi:hypothetical protein